MNEYKNEIGNIKKIPIINNIKAKRHELYEKTKREILSNPENERRIKDLATDLNENFNSSTQIATNLRIGAKFQDTLTKKFWAYETFVIPFNHDPRTVVITELAHRPLEIYNTDHHMVFYDPDSNPSPRYMMSAIDFCVYLACKVWIIIEANNKEESEFLDKIR